MENREYYESSRSEMIRFIIDPPVRTIEFGCSSGKFSELLKQKYGCETWGVDIEKESVEMAKSKMDQVIEGNALDVINRLPENYFDYLICNDFIEHLPSPEQFFQQVKRCLSDDAIIIGSLPNVRHFKHFARYFFLKDWRYKKSGILDFTHLRFFTKKSMKRSIKNWGFQMEKMKGLRPTKSPLFYLCNLLSLNFIGDMRYLQYGFRARLLLK